MITRALNWGMPCALSAAPPPHAQARAVVGTTCDVTLDPTWREGDDIRLVLDGDLLQDVGPGMRNPELRDAIWIDVPELGDAALFEEQYEVSVYPGSRTWAGSGPTQGVDELLLTVYQGAVAGYLNLGGVEYSIRGSSDGPLSIIEAPETAYDDDVDVVDDAEPELESAMPVAPMATAASSSGSRTTSPPVRTVPASNRPPAHETRSPVPDRPKHPAETRSVS